MLVLTLKQALLLVNPQHLDRNLKEAKRDNDKDTAITKAGTKLLLHSAHFSCSWDTLGISTLKASAADT
ncbi:hypothetical protein Tco_0514744 [Tanacetum coccineum]